MSTAVDTTELDAQTIKTTAYLDTVEKQFDSVSGL